MTYTGELPIAWIVASAFGIFIFTVVALAKGIDGIMSWQERRRKVKDDRKAFSDNKLIIGPLYESYRMMTAGREFVAESLDREVRFYTNWIEQESKLLDKEIGRLVPIQLELIVLLSKATTRGRGGVSPAEFRDQVEGGRSGDERRKSRV